MKNTLSDMFHVIGSQALTIDRSSPFKENGQLVDDLAECGLRTVSYLTVAFLTTHHKSLHNL